MIVKKKKYMGKHCSDREQFYVYLSRPNISLNAGVRDWILPYRHVYLDTCENGDFFLIPTENVDGYKVTIVNHQAKFSCCGLLAALNIKERTRIPCEKQADGKILCKASSVQ